MPLRRNGDAVAPEPSRVQKRRETDSNRQIARDGRSVLVRIPMWTETNPAAFGFRFRRIPILPSRKHPEYFSGGIVLRLGLRLHLCRAHENFGGDFHTLSVACRSSRSARRDHGRGQTPGGSAFCRFRCGRSGLSGGFRGDCTGGLHPALSLWYNSSWRPFVVDVLILHHVFYHDCRRLCNIYPARHPPGGGLYTFFPFASATDPSPFSLSLSTRRNDLSRVSHDRMHFSNLPSCFSSPETSVDMV